MIEIDHTYKKYIWAIYGPYYLYKKIFPKFKTTTQIHS